MTSTLIPEVPELAAAKDDQKRSETSISLKDEKDDVYATDKVQEVQEIDVQDLQEGNKVISRDEEVAIAVISTYDDPTLPGITFRSILLGIGLSAFSSVLATIYTFKPQNATVSGLFCLIIAYILGTAMHSIIPSRGVFRYLNPGPFNIKEHTAITIMASTAGQVAVGMEIVAALDLFYDIRLNAAVAMFQIFATQMIGYGIAGALRRLLVYPTYAFYPGYISLANLLQSLHFHDALNAKKRRFFWIAFAAIFFWEPLPQYIFPLLSAISIICLADNGRHTFVRNLFGAGSSNEGIGLFSFSTSWTLITQGNPLVWPLRTQVSSYLGMALGYIILTSVYYSNIFNARDIHFMSTSLFSGNDASVYNQTAVITDDYKLNREALEIVGLPRYTATYATSMLVYNLSLGASITFILLWHWKELQAAFGSIQFLKSDSDIDEPHFNEMKKYPEVPTWTYLVLFLVATGVAIGCLYVVPGVTLLPAWGVIFLVVFSVFIAIPLGFITATTGFSISIKYAIQIIAAFLFPGQPIPVMYANLFGNSTAFQTLYMLQDLKLGQYTKLPPRVTFAAQMAGSIVGSIFNYTMMKTIVNNNREVLRDPVGTRIWSGWIVQQYNSASIAMGALGKELFSHGKPYWLIPFAMFIGLFLPIPFWLVWRFSPKGSKIGQLAKYIHVPITLLYIGWLPYSVNGMWWSCVVIGVASQWWMRTRHPQWFVKYNYLLSAALDGGSQVILFILSFAVFGASGQGYDFPAWWGNPDTLSADRCKSTADI